MKFELSHATFNQIRYWWNIRNQRFKQISIAMREYDLIFWVMSILLILISKLGVWRFKIRGGLKFWSLFKICNSGTVLMRDWGKRGDSPGPRVLSFFLDLEMQNRDIQEGPEKKCQLIYFFFIMFSPGFGFFSKLLIKKYQFLTIFSVIPHLKLKDGRTPKAHAMECYQMSRLFSSIKIRNLIISTTVAYFISVEKFTPSTQVTFFELDHVRLISRQKPIIS